MARTAIKSKAKPLVGIIMGSRSDWETMANAAQTLTDLKIAHECRVVSAHRTPDLLFEYSEQAVGRGVKVIIAGAGGAAHLPGMCAAKTRLATQDARLARRLDEWRAAQTQKVLADEPLTL